ncbi:MAG TPA: tannase/feruloyl esterase family alpha/beta hydrolase [Terracidiphilus sp.]|nr:tannase/feruloyl esterase family alpha/beta hydrolase [Terracidiphilus sp.]
MVRILQVLACLLAVHPSILLAVDCSGLKDLKLSDTSITLAQTVTSGELKIEGVQAPMRNLPTFCRVAGLMRPTSDSEIRFEVWLPEQGWNGRYLGVGNGGFAGSIGYQQFAGYLKRGFAVGGSDAGHQAESTDASWAYGHPEKVKDFGWRAVHLTAVRARQIITAYYGKAEQKAYFDACSDGGREALMEAQRFPEDYDGILAGAPANAWSTMLAAGAAGLQNLIGDPRSYISDGKLPAIQKAALDACDALDGVKDGIINNPAQCHFDPTVLLCKAGHGLECLTQPQIEALRNLYEGARGKEGKLIFPGFTMGDETAWGVWIVGQDPGGALSSQFVQNNFRYIVTGDPKWNVLTADIDETLRQAKEKGAVDLDSTNPDLRQFADRGGKLILYHGWNDPAISPWNTIAYYKEVQQALGEQKADSFTRLYLIPGMEHCVGGPGPSAFGQLGMGTAKGPSNGLFDLLQDWVERLAG